jgi:TonB family protein
MFSAMSILDVPGNKPGSVAADLEYGVTVHMIGRPSLADAANSINSVTATTHVLERGVGKDIVAEEGPNLSMDAAFASLEREAMARIGDANTEIGKDIRGRLIADDLHDFLQAVKKELSAMPGGDARDSEKLLGVERQRLDWLRSYWSEYPALTHNREMWEEFLQRNRFPAATPHEAAVTDAESALLRVLDGRPSAAWSERARVLRAAYIEERRDMVKRTLYRPGASDLIPRAAPCPAAATATSGTGQPRFGLSARPLDELWPPQSKWLGEEGTVMATLQVSATGCVTRMAIAGSSGSEMLDNTVLRYFESTEFIPADSNGKAIESIVTVPVVFKLKN